MATTTSPPTDAEKGIPARSVPPDVHDDHSDTESIKAAALFHKALRMGRVEEKGIQPIPIEERTVTRFYNIFTCWCSINSNILGITFGMLGPLVYGLSLRDSSLVILFFCMFSTVAPAYLATLGPKTGMRQMIQARYSFGRYLVSIPVLLNLATLTGFIVIIYVVGGQCLSAVSGGHLTPDVGIVIIGLLSLFISFCGFKVLHYYETYAFIPAIIAITIATGCGGSQLMKQAAPAAPPAANQVLSFGMIVASYMIPWAAISSDLTTYFDPKVPSWRVFTYSYLGLLTPTVLLMTLGAAIAGALPNVPEWEKAYGETLVGGVLAAMLSSAGGFGKFVVVILSLTLLGNTGGTMYAITLNFQTLIPGLVKIPRYAFAIVVTVIVIPTALRAQRDFFVNLENFVALIGYWSASFIGIVTVEHLVFRRGKYDSYDHAIWNVASQLPLGIAAIAAGIICYALVVPCMAQVWWTGPIAKTTGDIGFEIAFVMSSLFYVPFRQGWLPGSESAGDTSNDRTRAGGPIESSPAVGSDALDSDPSLSLPGFGNDELFDVFEDLSPVSGDPGSSGLDTDGGAPLVGDVDMKDAGASPEKPYTPYVQTACPASLFSEGTVEYASGVNFHSSDLEMLRSSNKENSSSPKNVKSVQVENPFTLQPPKRILRWDLNSFSASRERTGISSMEERFARSAYREAGGDCDVD
ncbi:Purine-cytosine permease FCY2 [Fusarium albosuccineum]|uniref:Purine-cytosine permease FCY2 n=1 Tax=Fusarium albosuccineum TaxID=1237068 RepID=A0A8H4L6T2_9HYPO|nr:Purine-cytosine permease FCY2 [Fusarium albosuccineum]